jgi:trimeric autotransporter adhesin
MRVSFAIYSSGVEWSRFRGVRRAVMTKLVLFAAVLALAFTLTLTACSAKVATTTTSAKATKTVKTTKTTHAAATTSSSSSTTSTTQSAEVWQTIRYEQGNPGIAYSGSWTKSSADEASQRGFIYTDSEGASLSFHFLGSYCGWLAKTSDQYGKAKVTVDDGSASTVDLYSKGVMWAHVVWETKSLPFGDHTVKIEWTGKKRTASTGTLINVDAFEIIGALTGRYEQSNSQFAYAGRWKTSKDDSASGGSFALTKSAHSSLTVSFTGIQIDWFAKQGPAYGEAEVTVDDGDPVTVDLYGPDVLWNQDVWSSDRLQMGPHVVTISRTGTKNEASTDTYINADALEIQGTLGVPKEE